ncbi:MAG: NADPH:quinone oxidoreductase family protein [Calditrichia bacterium]
MKAVLCKSYGPPESLVLEDIPSPKPAAGQLLLELKACGVNFPDTLIIQGKYQFRPEPPFSPGGDVAGIVKEVGEGVTRYKMGDRVFGVVIYGGFAEEVLIDEKSCFPVPDGMDFVTAASFMLAYGTSYHALKDRAKIQPGETLLVLGASGGVGLTAVELGKMMGARVIAAASTPEKLELCKQYGADEIINYSSEDLKSRVKALTDGKGVDVVYDPVGGEYSEAALRTMAWKGRFLVVGFAAGDIPKIPLNLALLKGCEIVGVFFGDFMMKHEPGNGMKNSIELLQLFSEGKIKPHIHKKYPLANAPQALIDMTKRQVMGKAIIVMNEEG